MTVWAHTADLACATIQDGAHQPPRVRVQRPACTVPHAAASLPLAAAPGCKRQPGIRTVWQAISEYLGLQVPKINRNRRGTALVRSGGMIDSSLIRDKYSSRSSIRYQYVNRLPLQLVEHVRTESNSPWCTFSDETGGVWSGADKNLGITLGSSQLLWGSSLDQCGSTRSGWGVRDNRETGCLRSSLGYMYRLPWSCTAITETMCMHRGEGGGCLIKPREEVAYIKPMLLPGMGCGPCWAAAASPRA